PRGWRADPWATSSVHLMDDSGATDRVVSNFARPLRLLLTLSLGAYSLTIVSSLAVHQTNAWSLDDGIATQLGLAYSRRIVDLWDDHCGGRLRSLRNPLRPDRGSARLGRDRPDRRVQQHGGGRQGSRPAAGEQPGDARRGLLRG